ncbi:MAG: Inorganic phosphate transporter pho84 [Claussenomyces sp. TS43310]|nr:MAG: Inorganic phosphate transporter pho84 [Claussenomyces sp. TS43310]
MWPDPTPEQEVVMTRTLGGNTAFHNFHNDFSHIRDPNERRRLALSEIDKVPFGWYHVRAVVVAGIGFFTDSYDIFAINLATQMLGIVFWQDHGGAIPTSVQTAIKAATSGGTILGQLGFGYLADVLGRRRMYGVELTIILAATLAQSLASSSPAMSMTGVLIFWRVVMGVGIGGDYPMSSVITSEFAPTNWRGAMMAAVFSMQGAGQFAAALVALITTIGFKGPFSTAQTASQCTGDCQKAADMCWRIILGFGGVPALFALYYRVTIPETPRYTFDVARDIEKAGADIEAYMAGEGDGQVDAVTQQRTKATAGQSLAQPRASWHDFTEYFWTWRSGSVLFSTMASWFFLDLAYYGLSLNNAVILKDIGYSSGPTIYHTLFNTAVGNLILVCAGSIPGYWLCVLTVDFIGRKPLQIVGFAILTLLFCIIGFAYNVLAEGALLALYVLAQFFFNFGPNSTTFIIPGECFPTRYRASAHGLSAASGKLGAIVAQVIAQPLLFKDAKPHCAGRTCNPWLPRLMEIFALCMLIGTLVSLLVPETKLQTLEVLAGEADHSPRPSSTVNSHWLSPVLGPMMGSPQLGPSKKDKAKARRNAAQESEDLGPGYPASVTSDAGILRHPDRIQDREVNGMMSTKPRSETIPLHDVGNLLGRPENYYL